MTSSPVGPVPLDPDDLAPGDLFDHPEPPDDELDEDLDETP